MKLLGVLAATTTALSAKDLFEQWKTENFKKYQSPKEEQLRFNQWLKNKDFVDQHMLEYAAGKHTYTVGMNEFADLSGAEFANLYLSKVRGSHPPMCTYSSIAANSSVPTSVDWRDSGAVTAIKNQGQCGSCWAFSAIASLEAQWFLSGSGPLTSFSEQQLVDCSRDWDTFGCQGGLQDSAFTYIHDIGGVQTEADYPYTATEGTCAFDKSKIAGHLSSCQYLRYGDEGALQNAVAQIGPIAVGIDSSHASFMLYKDGVYYEPNCSQQYLDHGVTVVGYGSDNGSDYFLVKNSWGPGWGSRGYIKMARNRDNNCGIATVAFFPQI